MFKRIITLVMVSCFVASLAYSETTTEISGEYSATGTHVDQDDISYQYYSHEFDISAVFTAEGTTLTTAFGIVDKTWGDDSVTDDGSQIELDSIWLTHKFENGITLDVGKMTEGGWGTMLGDAESDYYSIKGTKSFGDTTLIGYLQKDVEAGATDSATEDAEKDDADSMFIGVIHQIGDISLMPKISYSNDSSVNIDTTNDTVDGDGNPVEILDADDDGEQTLAVSFAVLGNAGELTYETEINYIDFSTDDPAGTEYSLFNVWADANMNFGTVSAGISLAYGTEDEGAGAASFGTDFIPMILMDNDDGTIADLGGMMLARIYASATPMEKLTTGCAFAYGDYEEDAHAAKGDKTSIYEFDITAGYTITDALSYSASIAYADVESDDDAIMQIEHELVFTF